MSSGADEIPGRRWFTRRGRAWAWRLEEPFEWTSPRGGHLRGQAGDWWVITEDGSWRTVTPDSFAATYVQVEAQEYRRVGVVTARQTTEREAVATQEGEAFADPGDWIVTDADGAMWPVSPEKFAEGYEEEK